MRRYSVGLVLMLLLSGLSFLPFCRSDAEDTNGTPRTDIYALFLAPEKVSDFGVSFAFDRSRASAEDQLFERGAYFLIDDSYFQSTTPGSLNFGIPQILTFWYPLFPSHCPDLGTKSCASQFYMIPLGIQLHTKFMESVALDECVDTAIEVLSEGYQNQPFDAWIIGHPAYVACANEVVRQGNFSQLVYISIAGRVNTTHASAYLISTYEGRFMHGALCAQASNATTIGFVAPTLLGVDFAISAASFVAGARYYNQSTEVLIALSDDIYGSVGLTKATQALIDRNAQCIISASFSMVPNHVAANAGIWTAGMLPLARYTVGEKLLLNINFPWVSRMVADLRDIAFGNWTPSIHLLNSTTKSVVLDGFSTEARPDWRHNMLQISKSLADGSLEVFCEPQYTDLRYLISLKGNQTYLGNSDHRCMAERAVWLTGMTGMPEYAELVVNYDKQTSPYRLVWIRYGSTLAVVLLVLCTALIVASLITIISLYLYHDRQPYKSASPLFLALILVGIIIGCFSCLTWVGRPSTAACLTSWWLLGLSLALIYSSVLAKNWRIWKIFSSGAFKLVGIMNRDLLLRIILPIMFIEVAVLIALTITQPPVPITSRGPHLKWDEMQIMCQPIGGSRAAIIVFILYNIFLLIPAAIISYKTKTASHEYRETSNLAIVIYFSIIIELLIPGIAFAIPRHYLVSFYLSGFGIFVLLAVAWIGIFAPKLWAVHTNRFSIADSRAPHLSTHHSEPKFESVDDRTGTRGSWLESF